MPALEALRPTVPATPLLTSSRIVLIGFMGAGKSTVGRLLAARLGWEFVDTDLAVEQKHGCSIAELFAREGEDRFRQRESVQLARALGQHQAVIAVGGGAPESLTNRLLLEQTPSTTVIFLDAPFPVLFDRCVLQEGAATRPVLQDAEAAERRFQARMPLYRRCAQHHIRTEVLDPAATVAEVLCAMVPGGTI